MGDIILDPDFAQGYVVTRSSGDFSEGGWKESTPTSINMVGPIYPSTQKELQQVPEGDRVTGMVTFLSTQQIYVTHRSGTKPGTSDKILWQGDYYRIVSIMNWSDFGVWLAIGCRIAGD